MLKFKACAAGLLICVVIPLPLLAQEKANCKQPRTQTEMNICAGQAYKAADADLNITYKKMIALMKKMDADLPPALKGAEKNLREAQRAWIPYRDKSCVSYGFLARGGSMESMLVGNCLANITRRRIKELEALTGFQ